MRNDFLDDMAKHPGSDIHLTKPIAFETLEEALAWLDSQSS
ncbi:MAG: hypothetical protein ACAH05_08145 [Methylophilus sp.]|nr:hypothetical protein [Methylophilus sp.]